MATRPDIIITASGWVDLNDLSGIAVGTPMRIINKGSSTVYIAEGTEEPQGNNVGIPVTSIFASRAHPIIEVESGADTIYVRVGGSTGILSVQNVSTGS